MKKNIFYLLALIFSSLLFTGCISTSLILQDKKDIVLTYGDKQMVFHGDSVKEEYVDLSPGYIYQYVSKQEEGALLVYETTVLHENYRYNHGTLRTMKIIFDARRVETIYTIRNMSFFQIELKDGRVINTIVQQSLDDQLAFAYGYAHEQFAGIMEEVKKPEDVYRQALKPDVFVPKDPEKAILSQWKPEMLIIDIIFAPVARMMMS